jgi:hypothetical protein
MNSDEVELAMKSLREAFCFIVAAIIAASAVPARADPVIPDLAGPEIKFPIVFTAKTDLEDLGLSLDWPPPLVDEVWRAPRFPNGCYLYRGQDRDHLISISSEFLDLYKAKGFSRESLCMALVSEARFNPETGARLATYVLRDDQVLEKHLNWLIRDGMNPDELSNYVPSLFNSKSALQDAIKRVQRRDFHGLTDDQASVLVPEEHHTFELPLQVPDCFKNGTPFLDCNWKYGLKSGKKLSGQAPKRYREVGELLDKQIKAYIASGQGERPYDALDPYFKDSARNGTYLLIERLVAVPEPDVNTVSPSRLLLDVPEEMVEWAAPVAWYATSPSLPRGYGYALYAWSSYAEQGGPAVSVTTLRAAFDSDKRSSLITPARLQKILH